MQTRIEEEYIARQAETSIDRHGMTAWRQKGASCDDMYEAD